MARGLDLQLVIVGGIELANQLANLQLSDAEKLRIATEIEGHWTMEAPAIFKYGHCQFTSVKMSNMWQLIQLVIQVFCTERHHWY